MKNKLLLVGLLGTVGVLGYFFLKRKPQQVSTMPTQPPIPDSPPSKPEQSFLGATIVRQEKDGSSVQTTVKKDPLSNFYTQDTSIKEAEMYIKQVKELIKIANDHRTNAGCKGRNCGNQTIIRNRKIKAEKMQREEIQPLLDKIASLGWVQVGNRFVKAGTVLG